MSGETNLDKLLANMSPELIEGEYVFCTFAENNYGDHKELNPIASFQESEGLTLVIPKEQADAHNIDYQSSYRGITLQVHSSLEAVGLTAAFAKQLSQHGISANVIAGYYHDHIFVQTKDASNALEALTELTRQNTKRK